MANKVLAGISLFFCLAGLGLTTGAFYADNWANFDDGNNDNEYGLFLLTDGSDQQVDMSWDCWKVLWCEISDKYSGPEALENSADAWCDQATAFKSAALLYYVCQLLALALLSKYCCSCFSIIMDRDPGHKIWMAICSIGFTILSLVGFAGWWGLTQVSYSASCDSDDYGEDLVDGDRWELCAGMGATFGVIAFCFMMLAGILAIANTMLQNDLHDIPLSNDEVMFCGIKIHFAVSMAILWTCIALAIAGISIRDWVNFEDQKGDDFKGSLFAVDEITTVDSSGTYDLDNYGWDCISVGQCDTNDDGTVCKTFKPLRKSGRYYLGREIGVIGLLLVQNTFFLYSVIFKREWGHPLVNYAIPHFAWMLHFAATVIWAIMSEVKFEQGDCENDDVKPDEQFDVCIKTGPILMIIQLVLLMFNAFYFSFIYYKRGTPVGVDAAKGE